jgi:ADP-ribose pyrophosphatase YjhB (NUDIX family)
MTTGSALSDGELALEPTSGNDAFDGWSISVAGNRRGTIALHRESRSTVSVRWNVVDEAGAPDMMVAIQALRLIVDHALGDLEYARIEARIPVTDDTNIRAASICGLRREGITRSPGDEPDRALMARLANDPPATSREGFIALLNAGLPTKRVIAQGLLTDQDGRILLCRLTYKPEWDLPGGVVEVGEAPAAGLVRELEEELGITVAVGDLITVNWLPAWRGWDDACIFLFDLGVVDATLIDSMRLQATEIAGVEWCDEAAIEENAAAASQELLAAIRAGHVPPYREAPSS